MLALPSLSRLFGWLEPPHRHATTSGGRADPSSSRQRPAPAQRAWLDVEDVEGDAVSLGHGRYRAVLEVSGANFGLLGDDEQDALLAGYAAFLNGLTVPVQILVRVLPVDAERYAGGVERGAAGQPEAVAELARDHAAFVRRLARRRALLQRRFYVVVPAEARVPGAGPSLRPSSALAFFARARGGRAGRVGRTAAQTGAGAAAAAVAEAHRQLNARCDEVQRQLARCGLRATRLRAVELASLLYACWCPELSRVQRLRRQLADYTAPVVRAAGRVVAAPTPTTASDTRVPTAPMAPTAPTDHESDAVNVGTTADADARFALGERSVADLIAPGAVEVARGHVRLDSQYARTLAVTAYPRTVSPGWLQPLIDFDTPLEVSLHVQPLDTGQMVRTLTHRLAQLHSSRVLEARGGRLADPEREVAYEDVERLREALQRGDERVFSVGLYVLVRADSPAALDDLTRRVEATLDGMLAASRVAHLEQDAGFRSCLPQGTDRLLVCRNLDTSSLATTFPFASGSLAMDSGVLLGLAAHNHSPVVVDPFDPSLENANAVVFAKSGAGKSYFTKLVALRSLPAGVDFIVIDPENEYRTLCRHVGGQHVRVSGASGQHLNPFDLPPAAGSTTSAPPADGEASDALAEQVAAVLALVEVMLAGAGAGGGGGQGHVGGAPLSAHERAVLDRALYATYASTGITADPATHGCTPPLMRDLLAALEGMPGDVAGALAARLRRYVEGSLAGLFAGPTNVALDGGLVVFDTQGLEPELRPVGIHLITSHIWNQVRRRRRPRLLVIDEAWTLLQYPQGGAFIASMARRARKYHLGLVAITQDVGDFLGSEHGRAVLANASVKLLMKQDSTTVGPVVDAFGLSPEERQFLLAAGKGEGLLYARGARIPLRVEASPLEHQLATTAPRELAESQRAEQPPAHDSSDESDAARRSRGQLGLPLQPAHTAVAAGAGASAGAGAGVGGGPWS